MTRSKWAAHMPFGPLRIFATGVAMGVADVIPGVSGGTMAFILGIYEHLLHAIKSFNLDVIKLLLRFKIRQALDRVPWQFLLVLLAGIGSAVFTLAHVVSWLLVHQTILLFAFFFGLILASILAIGATVRWSATTVVALIIGTVMAYLIVGLVPLDMPNDPLTLLLSGMVAIMAMILPGISGSFILLILGQYEFALNAVKTLDMVSIIALGAGAVIGIIGFARVLSWLLKHYHQATVAMLVGFMIGSLRKIWPWKETVMTMIDRHGEEIPIVQNNVLPNFSSPEFFVALALCLLGFLIVTLIDHLQSKSNPVLRLVSRNRREADVIAAD